MLRPGDRFARYRIEKMLGEGGMGLVYRAYDIELDRRVALKVVHANVARAHSSSSERDRSLSEAAARLLREGREAAGFNHPNAVSVIDVGEVEGTPYIAMELVSGRTLRTYVGDRAITMDRRISWLAQIAEGLEAAHLRGLVHRDVKPENVMVCNDGTVKLMDFGGVKKMEPDKKPASSSRHPTFVTRAGMVVGTPMYMAPEQAIGEQLDGRSDQFAWGTLAYELLTGGIHPIHTNNPKNLPPAFAVIQRHPKPLSEVGPEIPQDIRDIITRAMKKSRDERYETMGEVASSLRRYLKLKHVKAPPHGAADDAASAPTIVVTRDKPMAKLLAENAKRNKNKKKKKDVPIVKNVDRERDNGSWAVWILVALIAAMSAYVLSDFVRLLR